jgi:hypothetical protein
MSAGLFGGKVLPNILMEPPRSVTPLAPSDPARLGYPPTFPIEIAMRTATPQRVCEAYGITHGEWLVIKQDERFLGEVQRAIDMLKQDGMSFKLKAKLQIEELLKTSWRMIHDPRTPPQVQADLIKATARWAGYDSPAANAVAAGNGFMININFANVVRAGS